MFEILTKLTTVTTGKKSDQNVSLFCCVVLFDDWYRCNETSSNTIIECNKRGTVAETLLPSLYVTWLIIAVANEYARSHRTNIHSELDAANEARRCRCRCSRPAHSHSHKSIQIHAHCIASASCEMIRDRFPFAVPIRSTASDASEVNTEKQWIIFVRGVERGTLHCKGVGYRLPFSSNAHSHTHAARWRWVQSKPTHTDSFGRCHCNSFSCVSEHRCAYSEAFQRVVVASMRLYTSHRNTHTYWTRTRNKKLIALRLREAVSIEKFV